MSSQHTIDLPPGHHHIRTRWRIEVLETAGDTTALVTWESERDLPVEILPAGTALATLVHDESLRRAVERAVKITDAEITRGNDGVRTFTGNLVIANPPIALGVEVFASIADPSAPDGRRLYLLGRIAQPAGQGVCSTMLERALPAAFDGPPLDILLRASPRAAEESVNLTEVWGGDILLKDVPVQRPGR